MINTQNRKGVDISDYQRNINMAKIKAAGYDFVMIKCGLGSDIKEQDDVEFESNVKKAEHLGMPWGVYLYSYATNVAEAKSEVEHVKRLLKGKKPTMPIALDVEDSAYYQRHGCFNKTDLTAIVGTFINGIKAAGFYPMIYTGVYWLDYYIDKSVYMSCDLWIAQWVKQCTYKGSNLGIWQYGGETNIIESNSINGVGVIDKDLCYKDYPSIIINGGYNGWSGAEKPPETKESDVNVTYRVCSDGVWQSEVTNLTDYAGIIGVPITGIAIKVDKGEIVYQAHVKGAGWLSEITNYDINDLYGYAGNGQPIDAIRMYYYTPDDVLRKGGYKYAEYRVSPLCQNYYSWQIDCEKNNNQDGYAGVFGKEIDRLQIQIK